MAGIVMDYKLAYAVGLDAGNRSMRKSHRSTWSEEDSDAATEAMNAALALIPGNPYCIGWVQDESGSFVPPVSACAGDFVQEAR